MNRTVRFWRIGSDPELVFTRIEEWRPFIVAANTVVSNNRNVTLQTFIGTDGHAATAELRPPPSHNVGRHLYDIASAIDAIQVFLSARPKFAGLQLMSQPIINGEPLGGHIHTSFFVKEALTASMLNEFNLVYTPEGVTTYDQQAPTPVRTDKQQAQVITYEKMCSAEKLLTFSVYGKVMAFLGQPLEWWLQPWFARADRNGRYGRGQDTVRLQRSAHPPFPTGMNKKEWAYYHYEYRLPSTWLSHPWLASAYLSAAKLTMLNFDLIRNLVYSEKYEKMPSMGQSDRAYNREAQTVFLRRLAQIEESPGYRASGDVHGFRKTLTLADTNREKWFAPSAPVDVAAWRGLL